MKKTILILISLLAAINIYSWVIETGTLEEFTYGHNDSLAYDNWLSHVVEGIADEDYNLYAPYDRQTNGFGNYTEPNDNQMAAWGEITTAITGWNYELADTLIAATGLPFELVEFNDTVSDNTFWIVREQLNMNYVDDNGTPDWTDDDERGSFDYGWGLYIFNPMALYPVIITTPHINDDYPTLPMGIKLFRDSGAYALMANGTGREVLYDDSYGYYSNSFSLCDPTREEDHVLNNAYQACCDFMRSNYGHRELSIQVHSYDWNRHQWYSSCQISAGWGKNDPGLPIRDYSQYGWDIANQGREYMLETNEVGIHPAVHHRDYYTFNCSTYEFNFTNEDTTFAVNTSMDLPGYRYNKQMSYTDSGWNDHLSFEPFFHIEMDELPNCYPQSEPNYYWFWGYDPVAQQYDYDHLFDHCMEFYSYWTEDLAAVIPAAFDYDDNELPTVVDPLEIVSTNFNRVELSWAKTNCYDYDTYEVLYSTEPIANGNYEIWDRSNDSDLNNAEGNWTTITGLDEGTEYFFAVRVLDAQGNYSANSNEVSCLTGPARLNYTKAVASDSIVTFKFMVSEQNENAGFYVYRKAEDEDNYTVIDSWETNPDLAALNGINNFTYTWIDSSVTNWTEYSYIAAGSDSTGNHFWYNYPASATPYDIYTLHFMHEDSLLTDNIWFGANPNASDGFDVDYDLDQDEDPLNDYVFAEFYEEDWTSHQSMIRQIEGGYNFDTSLKSWVFRVKSNQYNDNITIYGLGQFIRDGRKLYLIDQASGQIVDLLAQNYTYQNASTAWRYFTLYWGNILPSIDFANPGSHIYQAGELTAFSWNINNNFLVENFDVFIITDTDEIQIADNLLPFFNQVNWTVPDDLMLENARIFIDLLMIDGDRRQYTSDFEFGCVPSSYAYALPSGQHLAANPFPDFYQTGELVGDAQIYELGDNSFELSDSLNYGTGYMTYTDLGFVNLIEAEIEGGNDQFDLSTGWNIVPNPHLAGCWRDDIRIITPDLEMTFAEAVQYELIVGAVYSYNLGWHEIEYIYPGESFLMYCYESNLQVKFIPYNDNHNGLIKEDAEYFTRLTATQDIALADTDELILELNPMAAEGYDRLYDLPEPLDTPVIDDIRFYTIPDSSLLLNKCNHDCRAPYDVMNEEYSWDFQIELDHSAPLTLSLAETDLPDDVVVLITIAGVEHDLSREGDLIYYPSATEFSGTITFRPIWMADDNGSIPQAVSLKNYPNPFYSSMSRANGISIAYSLPQQENINIAVYNIKGQKVKDIFTGQKAAGNHQITWDMQNNSNQTVSAGVYFTRIKAGDQSQYSKLVIVK